MKVINIAVILLITALSSCNNQLNNPIEFKLKISSSNSTTLGDTLMVQKNQAVVFDFEGNAEFITFYSGEAGHDYDKRELTMTPVDEIDSCYLTFSNKPQYGLIPGTLSVFASTSFKGMLLNDKKADSLAIATHNWINLTDSCNLATVSNVQNTSKISLKGYLNSNVTIAFRYKTTVNTTTQPTWIVGDLRVVVRDKQGVTTILKASDLGFSAFDMYASTNPYLATGGSGVWDLRNVAATSSVVRISSSSAGLPLNDDWMVSTPKLTNSRIPDTGVAVKSVATDVSTYQHVYTKPGLYKAVFRAMNDNFEYRSETGITKYIRVQ